MPSLREYTAGLGPHGAPGGQRLGDDAIVTHPGPMVRGVEIASDVADLPRTVVTQQVANGVAVRMAILFLLLGGERPGRRRCPPLPDGHAGHPRRHGGRPRGPARLDVAVARRHRGRAGATALDPPAGRHRARRRRVPGRARPRRPAHAPAPARARGGRDRRDRRPGRRPRRLHGRGRHAQHRAAHRLGRRRPRGARPRPGRHGRGRGGRRHHGRPRRARAGAARRAGRARRARSSPTTARACRTARSCAAPSTTPRGSASRWPSTARTTAWPAAAPCTREPGPAGSGIPGMPAAAEEVDGRPRHRAGAPHRRAGPLPPPLDRGVGRARAPGQGRRAAGDGRGGAAPHAAHPRRGGRLRPGLQGQPAAAHRRRRRRGGRRPVRRHDRRRRHGPRAARARGQGRALRPGAAGHARPADGAAHRLAGAVAALGPERHLRAR